MVLKNKRKRGRGILSSAANLIGSVINKGIDHLPVELHIPGGYQYCGPGTALKKRLARGDPGINSLDQACKKHDIAYSNSSDNKTRAQADQQLANSAWEVVKNPNSGLSERAAAYIVTNIMKAKSVFGGGLMKHRHCQKKRKSVIGGGVKKKKKKQTVKILNSRIRQQAIRQLTKHITGKGFYLRPYPQYSGRGGGRILTPPPDSVFRVRRRIVKKRRSSKKKKNSKVVR
jgi:Phospholipase A2-like domain